MSRIIGNAPGAELGELLPQGVLESRWDMLSECVSRALTRYWCYSSRNATIGSSRDARRAGIQHAIVAIPASTAATAANVAGSVA